jgi:hypothetical protein
MIYSLAGIALFILAAGFTAGMLTERANCERRAYDAEIEQYGREPGQHAGTGPSTGLRTPSTPAGSSPPWEPARKPRRPGRAILPRGGAIGVMLDNETKRSAAAPRAAIDLPLPAPGGPPAPQRGRYPDQDTGTLTKLTDTGELRAITDDAIAAMRADNAAWLNHWGTGAAL